jgi:hypothetical protein
MDPGRLEGFIPLAGGVAAFLVYFGVIPMKTDEAWKRRFGGPVLVAAAVCIVFGLLRILGVLR